MLHFHIKPQNEAQYDTVSSLNSIVFSLVKLNSLTTFTVFHRDENWHSFSAAALTKKRKKSGGALSDYMVLDL